MSPKERLIIRYYKAVNVYYYNVPPPLSEEEMARAKAHYTIAYLLHATRSLRRNR